MAAETRVRKIAVIALVIALLVSASFGASAGDQQVYFNTKSHKYHCLTCSAAKRCTVNCIKISRDEAIRRGGVACKICGGTCAR